ncbi:MAG: hypothetical protein U1B78_01255, partial [Dehalococcoidia bacterium]|nr:hypothetical protein [Dehalococcoidia bacterium]
FDLEVEEEDFRLEDDEGDERDPVVVLVAGGTPPFEVPEEDGAPFRVVFELPNSADPAELRYDPERVGGRFRSKTVVYELE